MIKSELGQMSFKKGPNIALQNNVMSLSSLTHKRVQFWHQITVSDNGRCGKPKYRMLLWWNWTLPELYVEMYILSFLVVEPFGGTMVKCSFF